MCQNSVKIVLLLILAILIGCDIRQPQPYIEISSPARQVYVADSTQVVINLLYSNDYVYNQRIYITTDNGYLRTKLGQYGADTDTINVNTDEYGKNFIYYARPIEQNDSLIKAWTYIDGDIKLENQLTLKVLSQK